MTLAAAKQLGQTEDPKELVRGSAGSVRGTAADLSSLRTAVDGAYQDFKRGTVPGWEGLAGVQYAATHSAELKRWELYLKLLATAVSSLETYAGQIEAAQEKAAEALRKWNEGEAKRKAAEAAYERDRQAWNDAVRDRVPADQMPPHPGYAPTDPGAALRAEAQEILDGAREDLDAAGATACAEMGKEDGSRTSTEGDWFGAEGGAKGPSLSWDGFSKDAGTNPSSTPGRNWEDLAISFGDVHGEAWVYRGKGSWEDYWGDVRMNADGTFKFLHAGGSASGGVDADGLRLNADGTLTVVGAEGEVGGEYGYAEGKLSGQGAIEATANGKALLGANGAHASGELFAGARAGAAVEGDVGGVGGKVGVEGWAGAGIGGDVNFGYESGKFTIGGSGGVAWGLGGKVSGEITLDFPKMYETGKDIVEGIGDWFD